MIAKVNGKETIFTVVAVGECECGDFGALYQVAEWKLCKWCVKSTA